jgi:pyruvate dehydrogenase E2 component (dihydrolipoamide acetyltransferase)
VRADVESLPQPTRAPVILPAPTRTPSASPGSAIPMKGMRRTIATRMKESLATSAQLTMDMDVVMDDAVRLREQLVAEWQAKGVRPSFTDLVVRAAAKALCEHPLMNSVFGEQAITLLEEIHVGIAVAVDDGLVVPVLRDAAEKSLEEIARSSAALADAARAGRLGLDDMSGGTFTVTALGMYGVDSFTPILNAPQSGILGVNRIRDEVAWIDERPVRQKRMRLSLTWDHRVLDGAPAARFLATVRDLLEAPYRLLV